MSAPRVAFVVSHTHWDREWYLTFNQFRVKPGMMRPPIKLMSMMTNQRPANRAVVVQPAFRIMPRKKKALVTGSKPRIKSTL